MNTTLKQVREIFSPEGLLASLLEKYEPRPGQMEMALAAAQILAGGKLAVEAETGIGKTLAYLIPAVLSKQKIVVSTHTINLQEQILGNEVPFIRAHIDPELSALCVKGRQNYVCLYRWQQLALHPQLEMFAPGETREKLAQWLATTTTGDRAEISWLEDDSYLWREISVTASQCLGSKCPHYSACYINELRRKAASARLLIVNHHLFFSDLALRREGYGEVLPRYESVIFDEAHNLENVATQYFGFSFSHLQLLDLIKDIKLAAVSLSDERREKVFQATDTLEIRSEYFAGIFPRILGKFPLQEFIAEHPEWEEQVQAVAERLARLEWTLLALAAEGEEWQGLASRAQELQRVLLTIADLSDTTYGATYIRWYERRERSLVLTASPIDVAAELNTHLYPNVRSIIFTSGTLTVGGDFSYFLNRLGLDRDTETLSLTSPFDYQTKTLLYVPEHSQESPFPQPDQEAFHARIQPIIYRILLASSGRALLLFTSLISMKKTYPYLAKNLPYPVLIQGQAPRHKLLQTFMEQTSSVLLATASFWEGINVPGESLSCVIIDKLPFEVPSDPVIMARMTRLREEGVNPFMDFQLPRAILALRQGVGRLMRTSNDRGVLAILDVRLFTKRYGTMFLKSLPPSPLTRKIEDVVSFFKN